MTKRRSAPWPALFWLLGSGLLFSGSPAHTPGPDSDGPGLLPPGELEVLSARAEQSDEIPFEPVEDLEAPVCTQAGGMARPRPSFDEAQAFVKRLIARQVAPGIAVGVSVRGEVVWTEGFGLADVDNAVPVTDTTMFSLASISKPFTATAVMRAVERGELVLKRPVNDYVAAPGVRAGEGEASAVTLRRVASHTSGLPVHFSLYHRDDGRPPPAPAEVRRAYAVTYTRPGTAYRYSNLGYAILEHVLSESSSRSFEEVLHREVFEPLGLRHTSLGTPPDRSRVALRYGHAGRPLQDYAFDHDGASAIYASAADLLRFAEAHLGLVEPPLLGEQTRQLMRTPVSPARGYGLGWGVGRSDGLRTFGHTGGMPGVSTVLRIFPESQVVVVVLANAGGAGGSLSRVVGLVVDALGLPARSGSLCALPSEHPIFGTWQGRLDDGGARPTVTLRIARSGEVEVTFAGSSTPRTLRGLSYDGGVLSGWFPHEEPGRGHPCIRRLNLHVSGTRGIGALRTSDPGTSSTAHRLVMHRLNR